MFGLREEKRSVGKQLKHNPNIIRIVKVTDIYAKCFLLKWSYFCCKLDSLQPYNFDLVLRIGIFLVLLPVSASERTEAETRHATAQ